MRRRLRAWAEAESAGGIVLGLAALAALIVANSALGGAYRALLDMRGEVSLAGLVIAKPLAAWVDELGMAAFFFLVGLEIKRELLAGALASWQQAALPLAAALGGMAVPALVYAAINHAGAAALRGWAIPMATDIAFAIGVLALLGPRVPPALKVFLAAVAVIDDLGAIAVIAGFYTEHLAVPMLLAAAATTAVLLAMNRARVASLAAYAGVGLVLWVCVLKSGVHPTLAGVVTALAVPLGGRGGASPLRRAEHALKPWVAFFVLPAFAFVSAGVGLAGVAPGALLQGVPLGIAAGLVLGKPAGVFAASWLLMRATGARLPEGASARQFAAVAMLCGIGFTMSLFIGGLAFASLGPAFETQLKIGVLGGSLVSAVLGVLVLVLRPAAPAPGP